MNIVAWGDSITYGSCDSEALGWIGRLRKEFPRAARVSVYNRGIPGNTTEDLLRRFAVEAESIGPDIAILAIGINDSKYPSRGGESVVSFAEFQDNVRLLVEKARKYSKHIFLVGLTDVDESVVNQKSDFNFGTERIGQYNSFLSEFANEQKIPFIDVFGVLDTKTDLFDGLHPNDEGYEKLYLAIRKSIFEALPEYFFTGAKAAVFFGDKLVIYLRDDKPDLSYANMWDFPGGGREGNETPFECLARELDEEFGFKLKSEQIQWHKLYKAMRSPNRMYHFFVVSVDQDDIEAVTFGSEGQRWELCTPEDFLSREDAVPHLKDRLRDYLDARMSSST